VILAKANAIGFRISTRLMLYSPKVIFPSESCLFRASPFRLKLRTLTSKGALALRAQETDTDSANVAADKLAAPTVALSALDSAMPCRPANCGSFKNDRYCHNRMSRQAHLQSNSRSHRLVFFVHFRNKFAANNCACRMRAANNCACRMRNVRVI